MISYRLDDGSCALEKEFPQLCFRLRQLEDRLISYLLRGAISCVVSYSFNRTETPRFAAAAFEAEEAQRYEAFMEKYFRKTKNTVSSELPRPCFPVELDVKFVGGETEKFIFPFQEYSDDRVLAFCKEVEARDLYYFRHRFCKKQGKSLA